MGEIGVRRFVQGVQLRYSEGFQRKLLCGSRDLGASSLSSGGGRGGQGWPGRWWWGGRRSKFSNFSEFFEKW